MGYRAPARQFELAALMQSHNSSIAHGNDSYHMRTSPTQRKFSLPPQHRAIAHRQSISERFFETFLSFDAMQNRQSSGSDMERTPTRPTKPYDRKTRVKTVIGDVDHSNLRELQRSVSMETHPPTPINLSPTMSTEALIAHDYPSLLPEREATLADLADIKPSIKMETRPSTPDNFSTQMFAKASIAPGMTLLRKTPISKELGRFALGNGRFAVVCVFKGETKVHVREYADEKYPTKKGISLSPIRWAALLGTAFTLDEILSNRSDLRDDYRAHLGGFVYVKASKEYGTIDIPQYFIPDGQHSEIPTKKGVTLRNFEWFELKKHVDDINRLSEDLINAKPCAENLDHANLEGYLACLECNPSRDNVFY